MRDVIIIGAGPAGLAAAVATLRRRLRTLIIAPDLGGKAIYRLRLPWMVEPEAILGEEVVEQLRHEVLTSELVMRYTDLAEQVFLHDNAFHVVTDQGGVFHGRALIVASGVTPHTLRVPGEQRLTGYGVSYSATSHSPLFAGRRVVVVGNDLRALRAVAELRLTAAHVTLIAPDPSSIAGQPLGQQLLQDQQVQLLGAYHLREVLGETYVTGIIAAAPDGSTHHIPADGLFIELGLTAHTNFLGPLVERSASGQIVVNSYGATRCAGLFAAGDTTSTPHSEQILIALGEGTRAGLGACAYVCEGRLAELEAGASIAL